jgi:hypothetical protein
VYIVSADVKRAFDSIDIERMLTLATGPMPPLPAPAAPPPPSRAAPDLTATARDFGPQHQPVSPLHWRPAPGMHKAGGTMHAICGSAAGFVGPSANAQVSMASSAPQGSDKGAAAGPAMTSTQPPRSAAGGSSVAQAAMALPQQLLPQPQAAQCQFGLSNTGCMLRASRYHIIRCAWGPELTAATACVWHLKGRQVLTTFVPRPTLPDVISTFEMAMSGFPPPGTRDDMRCTCDKTFLACSANALPCLWSHGSKAVWKYLSCMRKYLSCTWKGFYGTLPCAEPSAWPWRHQITDSTKPCLPMDCTLGFLA